MANPNPQIYRTPDHWVRCKILSSSPDGVNLPKIVDWCGDNRRRTGTIGTVGAVPNGYLQASEPLDLTLCPTGQDPNVSCFSEIWRFQNPQSDAAAAIPTEIIEHKNTPCNWTFGEVDAVFTSIFGYLRDKSSPLQRWSPYSANDNNANTNWNFSPYVTWGIRGALLQIRVMTITEYDNYNGVLMPRFNDGNSMTLDEWKNNHSTEPIQGLSFVFSGNYSDNGTTIAYQTNWNYDDGQCVSIACLDPCGEYNGEPFYDYTRDFRNRRDTLILFPSGFNEPYSDTAKSVYFYGLDKLQGAEIRAVSNPESNWRISAVVPYSQENYNAIMKIAACFGMAFTPTNKGSFTLTDNDYYLPVIRDNGVSYGEYTHGTDNETNATGQLADIRTVNYDPSANFDPNTYSNVTSFNYITEGAAMTVRYVLDGANVDKLLSDLWTINASIAQGGDFEYFDGKIKDAYLTTNPIDCIVSLIRYPFNIPYQPQPLQSYVKLGKTAGSAKGWTTVYISNQINFKGINIFPRFGDCFLDYEPYTTYELYVPFCGTTKIRAADILGHTLNLTMLIDLITGSCTAYVKADQLVIETLQGSCGVQQQISGTDTATMNANIYNGILAQKQAKAGMIAQGASALLPSNWVNPVGYAAKGEQAEASYKQATYAIEHIETPVHSQGAASPLLGWVQEFNARLMIYYPEGDVITSAIPPSFKPAPLAAFGHLKGYATATPGTVGSFRSSNTAFLSGDIIAGDIPCTLSERNRIKSMFADGVYLPPR